MKILIIDYGMGNLGSVKRAVEECGVDNVTISHSVSDFEDCTHAILPGVGAFPDAMKNLEEFGLVKEIKKVAIDEKIPFLGICLGMQLLASTGTEVVNHEGLGLIPGRVVLLSSNNNERIPHVGWNEIHLQKGDELLNQIPDKSDFYFVHSYHFIPDSSENVLTITPYCDSFVSSVSHANIKGTQFHPEKSSTMGFQLLRNFLTL